MKRTLALLIALLLVPLGTLPAANAPAKPNIIVILADDLGYGDVGCFGSREIRTPNLDRMAAEGMRFTSFYAQSFCGPSRAALMTGCYPLRLAEVGNQKHHMTVPHAREALLSEVLKGAGYATAQIGKWDLAGHLPDHFEHPGNAPLQRGFDFHFGTPASNDRWTNTVMYRNGAIIENPVNLTESTTKRYADEAIRFIRERKARPFFIYLCPNMPHITLHAGADFRGKSPRGLYGDVVEELDHHIGRILAALRSEGVERNTLVFFTSDNGPWLSQKENGGSAGPLRGGKTSTWEGGVRVPAIAWAPGRIAPGQTCSRIASTLDLLPSLTKLANAKMPGNKLDGRDISTWLLQGPPADEDKAVHLYHVETHLQAVRQGRWKLHLARPYPVPWLHGGLRRAHVAEADRFEIKTPLLYDLDADIGEQNDVAARHPEIVQPLLALAEKARAEIGDYDRIGSGARFFDAGPKRPDMDAWKADQNKAPASKAKKGAAKAPAKAARPSSSASGAKPNIVLILADDLGYGDVGCYGATKVKTPNMDRLAREGRRFMDAHSASAVCTPSRYALLTGEYPFRVNSWAPIFCRAGLIVDPARTTVASLLKRQGYATACVGKWHLGFGAQTPDWNGDLKPGPLELGFDYYFGIPVVSSHSPYVLVENHRVLGLDPADPLVFGGKPPTQPFPEKLTQSQPVSGGKAAHALYRDEELATTLTQKAIGWIREHRAGSFFLYLATPHIHHPFTPAPRFKGASGCGRYGDFNQELDWMVGEVLGTLDELKLTDNTLVILTSDNGGMLNEGGRDAWQAGHRLNGNLLGFKFGAWEGGHRVPFIARWPGHIAPGSTSDQLIAHVDLLATLAAVTGQKLAPKDGPDSFNVLPAWTGSPAKPIRDHVVLAPHLRQNVAIRAGQWVYLSAQGSGGFGNGLKELAFTGEVNSDVTPDGSVKPDAPPAQLYDLATDPSQSRNVIREHPEVAARLKALLQACRTNPRTAPAP